MHTYTRPITAQCESQGVHIQVAIKLGIESIKWNEGNQSSLIPRPLTQCLLLEVLTLLISLSSFTANLNASHCSLVLPSPINHCTYLRHVQYTLANGFTTHCTQVITQGHREYTTFITNEHINSLHALNNDVIHVMTLTQSKLFAKLTCM